MTIRHSDNNIGFLILLYLLNSKELNYVFILYKFFLNIIQEKNCLSFCVTKNNYIIGCSEQYVSKNISISDSGRLRMSSGSCNSNIFIFATTKFPPFSMNRRTCNSIMETFGKTRPDKAFNY